MIEDAIYVCCYGRGDLPHPDRDCLGLFYMKLNYPVDALLAFVVVIFLGGCQNEDPGADPGGRASAGTPVVAVSVVREPVVESLSLVGTLEANELVEIKAETLGIVEEIAFEEGQDVAEGDVLIRLDRKKLQSAFEEASANLRLSESEMLRDKQLFEEALISQQEFDQTAARVETLSAVVELRKRELRDAQILAPFSGVVGSRNVSPGQVITRDQTLTWLVDMDPVKVRFNIPERFLQVAKKGLAVSIKVAAFPNRTFEGDVYFVAPFVDSNTRNIEVKALIPNPERFLIPGMFANLELTLTIRQQALVIPEMALFRTLEGDMAMVYVVDSESAAEMKTVSIGERMAGKVEVLNGLDYGDLVIVEGTQKIGPGAPVVVSGLEE